MGLRRECGYTRILKEGKGEQCHTKTMPPNRTPDGALYRYGNPADHPSFNQFVATISALRAPDGCPWDREQTHVSISHNMIEEAYEAVCAIEEEDVAHLREELGDVLLQVVLQSQIAADAGEFTVADVCRDVNAKMIRRHPHVFGEAAAGSAEDVLSIWDNVKLAEKSAADAQAEEPEGLLDSVPASFPALLQAYKISRKAVAAGFEWDTVEDVWAKVEEEIAEFKQACRSYDAQAKELEFGDVLFSLVNVARKEGIVPRVASSVSVGPLWKALHGVRASASKNWIWTKCSNCGIRPRCCT